MQIAKGPRVVRAEKQGLSCMEHAPAYSELDGARDPDNEDDEKLSIELTISPD